MKKGIFIFITFLLSSGMLLAQSDALLGACTTDDLRNQPYSEWFVENYSSYLPNETVIKKLKSLDMKNISVTVFFGTWCEDSQREVPRFMKIMNDMAFPAQSCKLIAVGSAEPNYRQSPNHEEAGQHLYRVPTFIISRNGVEISRIVEYPAMSLERDLLEILTDDSQYIPNYPVYLFLGQWLDDGILEDVNVSYKGLANQVRYQIQSANELNGFANLVSKRDRVDPKVISKVLRMNRYLYPDIYWTYTKLAEALSNNEGKHEEATEVLQEGLDHIKNEANQKLIQELLDTVMQKL